MFSDCPEVAELGWDESAGSGRPAEVEPVGPAEPGVEAPAEVLAEPEVGLDAAGDVLADGAPVADPAVSLPAEHAPSMTSAAATTIPPSRCPIPLLGRDEFLINTGPPDVRSSGHVCDERWPFSRRL